MENEVTSPIFGDNTLVIADKKTGQPCEYIPLGLDRIIVGVENPDEREILKDPISGYNFSRNVVEPREIYNKTKRNKNWFFLELCTGKYGWFPGCEIRADIINTGVKLYSEPNEESAELYVFNDKSSVTIIDVLNLNQQPEFKNWRKVMFETEGYIKTSDLDPNSFRYATPGYPG